jgi:hypothetical protein
MSDLAKCALTKNHTKKREVPAGPTHKQEPRAGRAEDQGPKASPKYTPDRSATPGNRTYVPISHQLPLPPPKQQETQLPQQEKMIAFSRAPSVSKRRVRGGSMSSQKDFTRVEQEGSHCGGQQ